jgi:hypothetical protein
MRPALATFAALAIIAALPRPARGEQATGDPRVDGALPLRLEVGQSLKVCETATLICPAQAPICDDGQVATWSFGPDGLEFNGVAPGETLCSAESANRLRRVYRVTVVPRRSP